MLADQNKTVELQNNVDVKIEFQGNNFEKFSFWKYAWMYIKPNCCSLFQNWWMPIGKIFRISANLMVFFSCELRQNNCIQRKF